MNWTKKWIPVLSLALAPVALCRGDPAMDTAGKATVATSQSALPATCRAEDPGAAEAGRGVARRGGEGRQANVDAQVTLGDLNGPVLAVRSVDASAGRAAFTGRPSGAGWRGSWEEPLRSTSPLRRPSGASSRSSSARPATPRNAISSAISSGLAIAGNAGLLGESGRRLLDAHAMQRSPVLEIRPPPAGHHRPGQDAVDLNAIGDATIGEAPWRGQRSRR